MKIDKEAFSILGRIVGTATLIILETVTLLARFFQYPRSDRGHCNHYRCDR